MPSRAKLTTRGISTTTVTTDTLPKNAALTNNELDSNFLNLRDQSFSIVGDDSTGIDIKAGDTIKFTGAGGATITASGDTITITAGGGGGGSAVGITFVGDDSTGTRISDGETVKIAGGSGITTAMSGDVLTITATGVPSFGTLQANGNILSPISTNDDLQLQANGTGEILLSSDVIEIGNQNTDVLFTTNGQMAMTIRAGENTDYGAASYIILDQTSNPPGGASNITISPQRAGLIVMGNGNDNATVTSNGAKNLTFNTNSGTNSGSILITQGANANIEVTPNGTGNVNLNTDLVRIGDASEDVTVTTNGGELRFNCNSGTNSGTILINDGTGQNIEITPDTTGSIVLDGLNWPQADGTNGQVLTTNGAGQLSFTTIASGIVGDFTFAGTTMSAGTTNADITITTTGTGNLNVDMDTLRLGDLDTDATITTNGGGALILNTNSGTNSGNITLSAGVNANITLTPNGTGDVILSADTVQIGDANANATLTTNGTGDLILNTNSGSSSGVIKIADGSAGKISIIPNTTGRVDLGHEAETTTNFPTALTSDLYNVDNAKIRGTSRFFSKLDYAPYTSADDQLLPHHDYVALKTNGGSFNSANIRNEAARHAMVFDLNGASATTTTTNTTSSGVRAQSNQLIYKNSAGGTKTGFNINTNGNFAQVMAGHGGALTIPRMVGYVNDFNVGGNTGETTTITEAWAFRDQGPAFSGTGTTGTQRVITNYHAYETGLNYPSSTNTPWAFYVRTSSQNWRSRIGAVDLPRRWSVAATHSSGGAYTVNFQTAGHGFHQITLTSNITSFTMSNFPTSTLQVTEFDLVFIQDGTGGRTISFTPTSTEVFKFRNGTNTLSDSTAAPEILHAKVFTRYDGTKTIFYWDIDNREYV